jgi:predicted RNA binding protein YcfA (HicA-like mRNA interferase family)
VSFKPNVWDQLRNKTADDLVAALLKDGWAEDAKQGASIAYLKGSARVTIHYHPQKTFGPKLLKALLSDIGWTDDDLRRLKLIK